VDQSRLTAAAHFSGGCAPPPRIGARHPRPSGLPLECCLFDFYSRYELSSPRSSLRRIRSLRHALDTACTVITAVPEAVGPWPVVLMAKVSLPLYLVFAPIRKWFY
jgi:hypothetical protein